MLGEYKVNTVPWIETIKGVFQFVENPIPVIAGALNEYGPTYYTRIVNGKKLVMTVDPDVIQHVLQKNNKNYKKSEIQTKSLGKYIGNGLLTTNGAYWLKQRRLIQPGFHKAKLDALVKTMHIELNDYISDLKTRIQSDNKVELSMEMMELTLRIVSKSLFSTGIDASQIKNLGKVFTELQEYIIREVRQPYMGWWRRLNGSARKTMKLAEEVKDILREIIAERRRNPKDSDDLLDMLLNSKYEDNGQNMSDTQILDEALILFTAGHETTANALTWAIYELCQNPEMCALLSEEYVKCTNEGVNMSTLMSCSYNSMVINETLRMYPPAWILDRVALKDDLVKNIKIREGDLIGMYVYGTHRHADIWDNPDRFEPNRFCKKEMANLHGYAFYPFGGGPRLCIGNHFAMLEMQMALGGLMTNFKWEVDTTHHVEPQPLITLRPKYGIKMSAQILA